MYMKDCKELIELTESLAPSQYQIQLLRDEGLTSRFEVTVYKTKDDMEQDVKGTVLHSKAETNVFPKDHKFEEFQQNLKSYPQGEISPA